MKSVPTELEPMVELDRLGALAFRDLSVFAHDEHRFVLPIAYFGQQQGFLPSPCRVILLDRHSDAVAPRGSQARSAIPQLRTTGFTSEDLLNLTRDDLSGLDDDWLLAGMELGIFSDVVVFGVRETSTDFGLTAFNDHVGQRHSLWIDSGLPGECFGFQGDLCDMARTDALQPLWDLLDWKIDREGTGFRADAETVLVTIDLDAFAVDWEDFLFAWPVKVWEGRFLKASSCGRDDAWSGKRFVRDLLSHSGMLALAREPRSCGGEDEMQRIFRDLDRFVFDGELGDLAI
jgi:hypothetical protein